MSTRTRFRPRDGFVGDVIPYRADDGTVWLFYLLDRRIRTPDSEAAGGMPWAAVSTHDFVHFQDHGVILPSGGPDAADFDCYTGSVITGDDGVRHLFYTGHNPDRRTADGDLQVVCHATSDGDLTRWRKHPEHTFGALPGYAAQDWRDPFVYRPTPEEPWQMLLATRCAGDPYRRSGVVARLESDDLITWRDAAPAWSPARFITQECPDLFHWGSWWYLFYSEFSDSFQTRYRMSRSPDGPWVAPDHDTVDGRAFYAAKTIAIGDARYAVGWIATRDGDTDDGAWQWAGDMSALHMRQEPDGTLAFGLPPATRDVYSNVRDARNELAPTGRAPLRVGSGGQERHATWVGPECADEFIIEIDLDIHRHTHAVSILLRSSDDGEDTYILRLEPLRNRLVLDRWPRGATGTAQWQIRGDMPHEAALERPVPLSPGRHSIQVLVEADTCVAVVDDRVALSTRLYDRTTGRIGLSVTDGEFDLTRLVLRTPPSTVS